MKQLYLIDFSNFAYKFKSVYKFARAVYNNVEVDTSVIYGFTRCLRVNMAKDIVIVLDGIPRQSLSVLPSYKGQRAHDEQSTTVRVPKLEVIQYLTKIGERLGKNIKVVCSPGQETDEVISSLVHHITGHLPARARFLSKLNQREIASDGMLRYLDKGLLTKEYVPNYDGAIIGSTDGDFIQLQRWPNVSIDTSSSGKAISSEVTTESTHGATPVASIAYKAIYGDISDNIPANKLSIKKEDVIRMLNDNLTTDEELSVFYNQCVGKDSSKTGLYALAALINRECLHQFKINWTVAFLTFRSYPFELEFPDYNIETTIKKYKLKV